MSGNGGYGELGNVKSSDVEILVADVDFIACGAFWMELVGVNRYRGGTYLVVLHSSYRI